MTQTKIVVPEQPLAIPPRLATRIGKSAATLLQQIHYWCRKSKHLIDGARWFWKTYQDWHKEIPYLSIGTIRRAIAYLRREGLILVERKSAHTHYQANWYTVNYAAVSSLWSQIGDCAKRSHPGDQVDHIDLPDAIKSYTETTSSEKISTDTPPNPPRVECEFEDELKAKGVNLGDKRLWQAWRNSPDPLTCVKAWLQWASTQVVRNTTGSLIQAIKTGWRPDNEPCFSGYQVKNRGNSSAAPLNNSQQKSVLESIPPCPEGLEEWAKYHKIHHDVKDIFYSHAYGGCWAVVYKNGTSLPWIDAVMQGNPLFKIGRNDAGLYVEVQ